MVKHRAWNTSLATGLPGAASTVSAWVNMEQRVGWHGWSGCKEIIPLYIDQDWECWGIWNLQQASSVMSLHRVKDQANVSITHVAYSLLVALSSTFEMSCREVRSEYLGILLSENTQIYFCTYHGKSIALSPKWYTCEDMHEDQGVECSRAARILLFKELVIFMLTAFSCILVYSE